MTRLLAIALALLLAGCASARHNTTYDTPPDYQGRQTPHSIP